MTYTADDVGDDPGRPLTRAERETKAAEWNAAEAAEAVRRAAEAAVRYRRQRALAYRDEMGAEPGNFLNTIGDVLDELLGWVAAEKAADRLATTEAVDALLAKRADIKRRFPKPE